MKKLVLLILLGAAVILPVSCQVSVPVPATITIEWDAPDEAPVDIQYEVYIQPYPTGAAVVFTTVTALEAVYTFTAEGNFRFGVRGRRTVDGETYYSDICWSDEDGIPEPWYVSYHKALGKPQRVRIK